MSHASDTINIKAARSTHTCDWCGTRIEAGEPYLKWTWFDEGTATTVKAHPDCLDAVNEHCRENSGDELDFNRCNPRGCTCDWDCDEHHPKRMKEAA